MTLKYIYVQVGMDTLDVCLVCCMVLLFRWPSGRIMTLARDGKVGRYNTITPPFLGRMAFTSVEEKGNVKTIKLFEITGLK